MANLGSSFAPFSPDKDSEQNPLEALKKERERRQFLEKDIDLAFDMGAIALCTVVGYALYTAAKPLIGDVFSSDPSLETASKRIAPLIWGAGYALRYIFNETVLRLQNSDDKKTVLKMAVRSVGVALGGLAFGGFVSMKCGLG